MSLLDRLAHKKSEARPERLPKGVVVREETPRLKKVLSRVTDRREVG